MSFIAFCPALTAGFVNYDDDRLFVENTSYRGFEAKHLHWMFSTTFMGHYQPLTWLSSALDYRIATWVSSALHYDISDVHPIFCHLNNIILHAVNALLVYFVAMRLLTAPRVEPPDHPIALRLAAATGALLFAIHPLRVESVAWATERRDVLSVCFLLLALLSYLRAFRTDKAAPASRRWFVASCGLLVLSLLSKAWGMSFVVLVTILDVYPLRRLPRNPLEWMSGKAPGILLQKLPYLLLGVGAAATAGWAQQSALDTMRSLDEWGISERVAQAFYGLAFYMAKTIWPTRLAALYELPYRLDPFELRYVAAGVAVVVGIGLVILLHRRCPALVAAGLIYAITLAPVLGFAQSGPQFVADKYSYVSCIGWVVALAGALLLLWRKGPSLWTVPSGAIVGLVLVALFVQTWRQTGVWHDSKTLWGHALAVGAESAQANSNYGIVLRKEGRVDEAIAHYRKAVEIRPDSGNAWFALANALKQEKKDYPEAEKAYHHAIEFMTQKHRAYLNLGNMYYNNRGDKERAIDAYRAAIEHIEAHRSKMFSPTPYLALGIALHDQGNIEEARRMLEVARKYSETRDRANRELRLLDQS